MRIKVGFSKPALIARKLFFSGWRAAGVGRIVYPAITTSAKRACGKVAA
jgi:hypothetical protein